MIPGNYQADSVEPIAVVGIGCRLPGGVTDWESLWHLLENGTDAIGPIPPDRWDVDRYYAASSQQPGRINAREGGFLDRADGFDAAFFGISGRIAEQMDPQQRLLLQVSWEALEDAGLPPQRLAGTRTGVFMGACSQDYGGLQLSSGEVEGVGPHSATGTFMSIIANRLSYTFDLRGPSLTIDTACSSSLVAVHLAVQSLHNGESDLAVAGGVNLMLTPQFAIALSQASMLSPDSRSRAFAAAANGYVRGEGAGVVVLKPLRHALRDRDRIHAVIRGSAVNQDGRTQGITVPNGQAQEENFRVALSRAGVTGRDVGYVEAHGTGTPVGDPLEADALGRVLCEGRDAGDTAYVGSIKTNIGHLEAGAGIAGLIKAVLCVKHRRIPPSLHFDAPNPEIDFERWRIAVPTSAGPWPEWYDRAIASVNSFGFGGTNANVVLAEPPAQPAPTGSLKAPGGPAVLALSARSGPALAALAQRYAGLLETRPPDLDQLAANLVLRRNHHPHRVALAAADARDAAAKLRSFTEGRAQPGVMSGTARLGGHGRTAFLFNGQGPQWYAMGRTLLETSPVFRAAIGECDEIARPYLGWSILDALLAPDESSSRVQRTYCLQPTMFAVQVALVELWKSWGVTPDAVVGHSMGEIAAAYVSGGLDLATALRVICTRARIQDGADSSGGMMFVALPRAQAEALCDEHDELWLSAENSPRASTVSGRLALLRQLEAELRDRDVFARVLRVNCACHSPDMEPLRETLLAELAGVAGRPQDIPMYSTVTGRQIDGTDLHTGYWWENFRRPVLFAPAIRAMLADGYDCFVELSPHPVLVNSVREVLADQGSDALVVSTLSRGKDDWESFPAAFAALVANGRDVDWARRHPSPVAALDLPTNPWVEETFWNESETSREYRAGGQRHPMLKRVDAARPTWEVRWDDHRLSWAREHDVLGTAIVPAAAYVEAALAASRELTGQPCALEYVEFERACVLDPDERQVTRLELDRDAGTFEFHHRPVRGSAWVRAAHGRFHHTAARPDRTVDLDAIRARCPAVHQPLSVYGAFRDSGYRYGPAFCGISSLHIGDREALTRVDTPRVLRRSLAGYVLHPAVLDACFQGAILHPVPERPDRLLPFTYLVTGIEKVRMYGDVVLPVWCHTTIRKHDAGGLCVDILVVDTQGRVVAEYLSLRGKVVWQPGAEAADRIDRHFYELAWRPERSARVTPGLPGALRLRRDDLLAELEPRTRELAAELAPGAGAPDYQAEVQALCSAYVLRCLHDFGHGRVAGEEFSPRDCAGLLPSYQRAFGRFLRFLVDDGVLGEHAGRFRVEAPVEPEPARRWADAVSRHPARIWELMLVRATGEHLHDVLTGRTDPLSLLFPAGAVDGIGPIYETSPISRLPNAVAAKVVEQLVRRADRRNTIRVLEVGAGTGGLTATVLPILPADRCAYTFTDVSPAFLQTARDRFQDYDFVEYTTLDLERDAAEQGFEPGAFDLVLAANVVHATGDLIATLTRLRTLLAPGGVLAMVEAAPGNRWLDLTFGLTTGWWAFRDLNLRPDGPLLTGADWAGVLRAAGYHDAFTLAAPERQDPRGSQTVVVGRAPEQAVDPVDATRPAGEPEAAGDWLIVGDDVDDGTGLAAELARRIGDRDGHAVLVRTDGSANGSAGGSAGGTGGVQAVRPGHPEDYDRVLASVRPRGIIVLWPRGAAMGEADGRELDRALREGGGALVDLVQALDRGAAPDWPRLFVLTRGAHAFRNDRVRLDGAGAWGLGLVAGLEIPQARCTVIDLDGEPTPGEADAVWAELWRPDHEGEVALRAGQRFTRRVVAAPPGTLRPPVPARRLPAGTGFALTMASPGPLDELTWTATPRTAPAAGQVEIRVTACGVNFLDVMTALGQVPPLDSASGYRFGAECAGVVTRVGRAVTGVAVGDAVVAVSGTQGALGSHLTVDAVCVAPKPAELSFEDAAGVPIVFLTAWFALRRLARIQPGERVLVHSAAGGTGLAALQIARLAGAEVLATAGTEEKRALLRSLGVRHVLDSRSPGFAEEVLAATGGVGVDVVLGASGAGVAARSLSCLAPYGRFVEIGKRDPMSDHALGLRPFLRNLAYFCFDLRQMLVDRPGAVRAELDELLAHFAGGTLRPVPYRVYRSGQTRTAFRQMAGGKHLGKIIIAVDHHDMPVTPAAVDQVPLLGSWLVTGGLGGVGLAMAESLADAGVRHLVLAGRSGARTPQAAGRVEALRARGVQVLVERVDVTSREQLADLISRLDRELPPLRGVLHSVMVLDDALLTGLDRQRLGTVLAGKALGAWHLHELTRHVPLDAFVLFSSATSFLGNVGQANYAAANAFLDHLAAARRAMGLPALAVNWGAVSDAGYVAEREDVRQRVEATGMKGFTARQAFEALRALLGGSPAQVAVLPMDWAGFVRHHDLGPDEQRRYESVLGTAAGPASPNGAASPNGRSGSLGQQLHGLDRSQLEAVLLERLRSRVATVLGIPIDVLDDGMPLMDYLDSLLAVEISSWIERELGVKVTIMELMKGPSITQLTAALLTRIDVPGARTGAPARPRTAAPAESHRS